MVVDEKITLNRLVGPVGDGTSSNDECVDPYFLALSSGCWNGLALGSIGIFGAIVCTKIAWPYKISQKHT
jgi:hypothetical protein